ncbi:MAG: hypothetical protein AAFX56_13875 [Pseudomonadota bacterium]
MIRAFTSASLPLLATASFAAEPLLTGVVEDGRAQTIEMPSLPGGWQRQIEWMAPEGTRVETGDVVVRLDPGTLIEKEEEARTNLDKSRFSAKRRVDEVRLEVMDAESELVRAQAQVRLTELDAIIPEHAIPKIDYDRYQLDFETARKDLVRREAELLNKRRELKDVIAETALEVRQAESNYARFRQALENTAIRAEKSGFIIYGDNPFTGTKVFPGETLYAGFGIASIASREDLQIRFWVHEADILDVRTGQDIEVVADALGGNPFAASVTWASSQAVAKEDWSNSGYFEVLASPVAGIPELLMPGMSVMGAVRKSIGDREPGQ